jgi:hypothetical protein
VIYLGIIVCVVAWLWFLAALCAKAMGKHTACPSIRLYEGGLH